MQLLKSQNLYPDLFSMALEAISLPSSTADNQQFDLYLSLNFNQQWYSLLDGRIKLALQAGQLQLRLENSELHQINPQLDDYFGIDSESSEATNNWTFTLESAKLLLADSLQRIKLGTVKILAQPFNIKATWQICPADVSLAEAEDLWLHDLSPNKHGVLERAIVFFCCKNQLPSSLSWVQLGSSDVEAQDSWDKEQPKEISLQDQETLKYLIEQIYIAKTEQISELAELAKLDLKTDLAGGNLLAANLAGIDLNGANLQKTNLRGVILNDADLSETNLRHANLGGADLSGAYLENADLTHANLYRASLAIANLIGANLTHANLQEANLSNASFKLAKFTGAKFGKNTGLSEDIKLILEQGQAVEIS
ncbi:putative low-complexity protein [Xenococcus sp. PCC 7305]|uniref:pentapeptide repeat-containing protein n=1 Tax=Xenococcus sp. PCC 7305 TaxID=102125 RepID=UPI0002AC3943|nr:pentapeptide repeat-containing protein [Xenococcus sp. PCC 7305]ELS03478.1 putative low-complexity protein [Xenococcus sp. PCC 7305]